VQPLSSGHLSTVFKFTTQWSADVRKSQSWSHYNLFPRSLGEIIAAFHVQELRLSLTQGHWRHSQWGHPLDPAPPGALVTARILPTAPDVDAAWSGLTSALAGLLCASLNTLDKSQAVEPQYSFHPRGVVGPGLSSNSSHLRYGVLPKENLCTENLTPWKKLLPCKSRRGLATLLSAGQISKYSSFQSLSLTFRPVCSDPACRSLGVELSQSVTLAFDPAVFNGRPDMADWSLKQLFGIGVGPPCPLADVSQVYVDITDGKFELTPPPQKISDFGRTTTFFKADLRRMAVYDSEKHAGDGIKNIKAVYAKPHIYGNIPPPVLSVSRHVVGTGNERGGIVSTITNTGPDSLHIVYLDTIPWFLRLYLHTMKITSNGADLEPITVHYVPGVDRVRPYSLEVVLRLPPKSTTIIHVDFEYSMLRWMEYPPDANHGFYVGSAVVTARLPSQKNVTFLAAADSTVNYAMEHPEEVDDVVQIFTEILLVALPTPDFSMPYNVICLACTVIALAFGPLHNITTKTLTVVPPGEEEKSILTKILEKVKNKLGRGEVCKKVEEDKVEKEETVEEDKGEEKETVEEVPTPADD